jgi:hypothetical protein
MNTRLDPPPVRPLTAAERARLRNRIMDQTRPAGRRPARRWIAPVVSVGAVAAVVAGTLVVTNQRSGAPGPGPRPGVAGTPSAQLTGTPEARTGVDLGPVPHADVPKIVAECAFPDEAGPAELIWSRQVRGITKDSTTLVGIARNTKLSTVRPTISRGGRNPGPGGAPSTARLGYRFCMTRLPPAAKLGAIGAVGRVDDKAWRTHPGSTRNLVALGGEDTDFTNDVRTLQAWMIYHASPTVATVEARYVLNGEPGPWTKGVVDGGFAYTEVQANGKFTIGQRLRTEVRAFDAQGHQLP